MDMVRIKVIIGGKVKYFAHKDKDGNIFLQDKKSDGLLVEAIECQDLFPEIKEFYKRFGLVVSLEKVKVEK